MSKYWNPDSDWDNHLDYPASDWIHEVENENTRLGYIDWVNNQIEELMEEGIVSVTIQETLVYQVEVPEGLTEPEKVAEDMIINSEDRDKLFSVVCIDRSSHIKP